MKLSIVTTLYYSAPYLAEFYERASRAAAAITDDYEIVLVNDGSPDNSLELAIQLHERDPRVKVVDLSRNFGHHKALMTGLAYSQGELVFLVDCDLEEEPELLRTFYDTLQQNPDADVVYGVQKVRQRSWGYRVFADLYFTLFNLLSDYKIPPNLLTARLMTRRYVDSLLLHREQLPVIAGLWAITGYRQIAVPIEKHYKGHSSYNFRKRAAIFINSLVSFSSKPLYYIAYMGIFITLVSLVYVVYLVLMKLFGATPPAGWTSLVASVWFLGGLIIFSLGVIGIYLSVIFTESKTRPYVIVRKVYGDHDPKRP